MYLGELGPLVHMQIVNNEEVSSAAYQYYNQIALNIPQRAAVQLGENYGPESCM